MLVATLIASETPALACIFDCDQPAVAHEAAAQSSCHRQTDALPPADFALASAPHDCASHVAEHAAFTSPRSVATHLPAWEQAALVIGHAQALDLRRAGRLAATHDLAPPNPGARLMTPLRI